MFGAKALAAISAIASVDHGANAAPALQKIISPPKDESGPVTTSSRDLQGAFPFTFDTASIVAGTSDEIKLTFGTTEDYDLVALSFFETGCIDGTAVLDGGISAPPPGVPTLFDGLSFATDTEPPVDVFDKALIINIDTDYVDNLGSQFFTGSTDGVTAGTLTFCVRVDVIKSVTDLGLDFPSGVSGTGNLPSGYVTPNTPVFTDPISVAFEEVNVELVYNVDGTVGPISASLAKTAANTPAALGVTVTLSTAFCPASPTAPLYQETEFQVCVTVDYIDEADEFVIDECSLQVTQGGTTWNAATNVGVSGTVNDFLDIVNLDTNVVRFEFQSLPPLFYNDAINNLATGNGLTDVDFDGTCIIIFNPSRRLLRLRSLNEGGDEIRFEEPFEMSGVELADSGSSGLMTMTSVTLMFAAGVMAAAMGIM